jgi:hypothetical protein
MKPRASHFTQGYGASPIRSGSGRGRRTENENGSIEWSDRTFDSSSRPSYKTDDEVSHDSDEQSQYYSDYRTDDDLAMVVEKSIHKRKRKGKWRYIRVDDSHHDSYSDDNDDDDRLLSVGSPEHRLDLLHMLGYDTPGSVQIPTNSCGEAGSSNGSRSGRETTAAPGVVKQHPRPQPVTHPDHGL